MDCTEDGSRAAGAWVPLSAAQQEIWFDQLRHPHERTYRIGILGELAGPLDVPRFERAIDATVRELDALRLIFRDHPDGPLQRARDVSPFLLDLIDYSAFPDGESRALIHARRLLDEPCDPLDQRPWAMALLKIHECRHLWLQRYSHLVIDGYSFPLIGRTVAKHYLQDEAGRGTAGAEAIPPSCLEGLGFRPRAAEPAAASRAFWRGYLGDATPSLFPPVPAARGGRAELERLEIPVPQEWLAAALAACGESASAPHLLPALLAAYLARTQGLQELPIGILVHNRASKRLRQTVGMGSSLLPLVLRVNPSQPFAACLERVAREFRACQRHGLPLSEILRASGRFSEGRLWPFDMTFSYERFPGDVPFGPVRHRLLCVERGPSQAPLAMVLCDYERSTGPVLDVTFDRRAVERPWVQRLCSGTLRLLQEVGRSPGLPVSRLPLMNAAERLRVLQGFNATARSFARGSTVHGLIEERAAATPEAIAVDQGGGALTYRDLNTRANRLARLLRSRGVTSGDRVALHLERRASLVVALLAVLKAGAAYVPLDPDYPLERRAHALRDARPKAALLDTGHRGTLPLAGALEISVDDAAAELAAFPGEDLSRAEAQVRPTDLAYVLYTSGSTGAPKGVMVEHAPLVNFLHAMQEAPGLAPDDRLLALTTLAFDIAGLELLLPLVSGARLVLESSTLLWDAPALIRALQAHAITVLQATPSTWRLLLQEGWRGAPTLKALCGGEALAADLARELLPRVATLWNLYGPTETTIWSSVQRVTPEDTAAAATISIGRPIANTRIYVLDEHLEPLPPESVGEIYIGGAGLARGYLGLPELTARRFVSDPFSDAADARLYRTGDLGKWSEDGKLLFLGRNDHQVKIRGFRIELGEIEAHLRSHPGVHEAVALAREDSSGNRRLVAYVVTRGDDPLAPAALRAHLRERLPEYMIPSQWVILDALPLTPNGKIDRKALPAPAPAERPESQERAPQGELQLAVARIWQAVLHIDRVGRDDNFFDLGGHSLLGQQAIVRVREQLGAEVSLRELFDHPTLERFASRIEAARARSPGPASRMAARAGPPLLSGAQQRFWWLDRLDGRGVHLMAGALRMQGPLNRTALVRALDTLIERHEILRTTFPAVDGLPAPRVAPRGTFALEHHAAPPLDPSEQSAYLEPLIDAALRSRFDLTRGPLMRGSLVSFGGASHALLLVMHHIVADGWSLGILTRELSALYNAYDAGDPSPLEPLPAQYADVAAWQRQRLTPAARDRLVRFWTHALQGAPAVLELPTDRPRARHADRGGQELRLMVGEPLACGLQALARRLDATLHMVLCAGVAILLSRLTGERDIVLGTPVASREPAEAELLIGPFLNLLPLRIRLQEGMSVRQLIQAVKQTALEVYEHQELPFNEIVEALSPPRDPARHPLFQVLLTVQNAPEETVSLRGLTASVEELPVLATPYDLSLSFRSLGRDLETTLQYPSGLLDADTLRRWYGWLHTLLTQMVRDVDQPAAGVCLLGAQEERHVLALSEPRPDFQDDEWEGCADPLVKIPRPGDQLAE